MNVLENYNKAKKALFTHVGFTERYAVYPVDDSTYMFWDMNEENIFFAPTKEDLKNQKSLFYISLIFKDTRYDKWVYEGPEFTMVFADNNVGGMKWLQVFDNKKRVKIKLRKQWL